MPAYSLVYSPTVLTIDLQPVDNALLPLVALIKNFSFLWEISSVASFWKALINACTKETDSSYLSLFLKLSIQKFKILVSEILIPNSFQATRLFSSIVFNNFTKGRGFPLSLKPKGFNESYKSIASVLYLAPLYFRRRLTRLVSYYAFFKGWLLLSQPPSWLCPPTTFTT